MQLLKWQQRKKQKELVDQKCCLIIPIYNFKDFNVNILQQIELFNDYQFMPL